MLTVLLTTFDCEDAVALSRFWAGALGYEITYERDDWVMLGDPERKGVGLGFQPVPERKTVKNRVHLDILVRDEPLEGARERLEGLGATTQRFVRQRLGPATIEVAHGHQSHIVVVGRRQFRDPGQVPAAHSAAPDNREVDLLHPCSSPAANVCRRVSRIPAPVDPYAFAVSLPGPGTRKNSLPSMSCMM